MRPILVGLLNTYGFIPDSVEFLVIAGGGGTMAGGGGGGAGGYLSSVSGDNSGDNSPSLSTLTPVKDTAYTVTVGGGGAGGQTSSGNGTPSVFASQTAVGGGRSRVSPGTGVTGGSGGGGGAPLGTYSGGAGTANQGNAGGGGVWTSNDRAGSGGGGGASAAGRTAYMIGPNPYGPFYGDGDGGAGQVSTIISDTLATSLSVGEVSGGSVYFAGGGGGGGRDAGTFGGASGGIGGGAPTNIGNGDGPAGQTNTGGGGGGTDYESNPKHYGGAGGSGVVIIRFDSGGNTPTVGAGLTYTETTDQGYKVLVFTSGSDTITWE